MVHKEVDNKLFVDFQNIANENHNDVVVEQSEGNDVQLTDKVAIDKLNEQIKLIFKTNDDGSIAYRDIAFRGKIVKVPSFKWAYVIMNLAKTIAVLAALLEVKLNQYNSK